MCPRLGASPRSRGGSRRSPQSQEGTREGVQCACVRCAGRTIGMMRVYGLPCDRDWLRVPPVSGGFPIGSRCRPLRGSAEAPRSPLHPRAVGGCAGLIRAEASGEALVRGSSGRRTCSGGARPRERLRGPPGAGEVHSISRATPRNHATRVSTEPARSTPSRMIPALTRDRSGVTCCAPLHVVRLMCASPTAMGCGNDGGGTAAAAAGATAAASKSAEKAAATAEATAATATATATTAATAAATAVAIAAAMDGGSGRAGGDRAGDQRT